MEFQLEGEFIELNSLLKVMQIAHSGGMAKQYILEGMVRVNGEEESRIRRKCRVGDIIEVEGQTITIQEKGA